MTGVDNTSATCASAAFAAASAPSFVWRASCFRPTMSSRCVSTHICEFKPASESFSKHPSDYSSTVASSSTTFAKNLSILASAFDNAPIMCTFDEISDTLLAQTSDRIIIINPCYKDSRELAMAVRLIPIKSDAVTDIFEL
eukprot:IDg7221t1